MTSQSEEIESPPVLQWAMKYALKGWRVLPIWWVENGSCACGDTSCRAPGKHPIGYMVPNGLHSSTDKIDIIQAWVRQAPKMNIAIATGNQSNLVVLDLDVREQGDEIIDGEFELKSWLASRNIELPDTLTQTTGGGGKHILLDWPLPPSGLRTAISSRTHWLPGVDIRADGGYIIAPPSQHVSGELYHWHDNAALAAINNDLIEILTNEKRQSTSTGAKLSPAQYSLDVQSLMREGFRMGERDDGFTRLAGILRGRGDSLDTARIIVQKVWENTAQNESDYFPLAIAYEKLERGYKMWDAPEELSEAELAWALRSDARASLQASTVTSTHIPPTLESKGSSAVSNTISRNDAGSQRGTESPFISIEDDEDDDEDIEDRDPSEPLDVAMLMESGEVERELPTMLRRTDGKNLIYPGRLHSIYGEPGHGKTWVSLHLVRERIEAEETVVYLDYDEDDGGRSMALRLLALGVEPKLVAENLRYLNPQGLGRQQLSWIKLKRQIKKWRPTLVIVDTMAPALVELGLNEKDNAEVGAWYAHARWLLRGLDPQAALVIIDHVVKAGEGRGRWARGAGDKLGRLHAAYAVESTVPFSRTNPGHIRLIIAKDRGGEVGREGEAAAVVKFTPHNNGQSLDIAVDVPESADLASLSQQHENRKEAVKERLLIALRTNANGLTYSELKRMARTSGPEGTETIDEMSDTGALVPDNSGRTTRYSLRKPAAE